MTSPCVPSTVRTAGVSGAKSLFFAHRSIGRCGNQMESTRLMREAPAAGRYASRAKQLGVPGRNSRRARVELVEKRRRARDAPAHPSATEVADAAKPNQPAGYARPLRRNREPPGRGEV